MNNDLLTLLLTQTWQIAALAIIVAVVVKLAARNRPHLAHALWILVLIKCMTPPLWGHSLGIFSQMQTLVGDDSDVSTVDAVSIVALSVLPAEVTQSHEPIVVEDALVPLTEFQLPQEDITIVLNSLRNNLKSQRFKNRRSIRNLLQTTALHNQQTSVGQQSCFGPWYSERSQHFSSPSFGAFGHCD